MHIAIIGNGISGITAARFIRKLSDHRITVISSESDHFFSRTALMYIYMGHMRFRDTKPYEDDFWEKNRIDLLKAHVQKIDFDEKYLLAESGDKIPYDKLIIACGSEPNKFGWPGQDLNGVRGMYSIQDVENMEAFSDGLNRAVIVGGGLIGIEMAEMFHSRNIPVTMLVREKNYWDVVLPPEESKMISRHIIEHGIDLRLETELKEILDDGTGTAHAIITNHGEKIECGYVGLTAGVHPNISWLKDTSLEIQKGILVNEFLETNIPDVYAIGDCSQQRQPRPGRRAIEAVWYTGRMMGQAVASHICRNATAYDPGIWFNSAKFLDIEYQVYGDVQASQPENQDALFWEHSDGKKSVRLIYDQNMEIVGFNLIGIRFRHEVCDKWLANKSSIEDVLQNLSVANFDPEFYADYSQDLIMEYTKKHQKSLKVKRKRSWDQAFAFLQSSHQK